LSLCFNELNESRSQQNLEQFLDASLRLLKGADPTIKSYFFLELTKNEEKDKVKAQQERDQAIGLVFQPQIDKKSKELVESGNQRQGRAIYERLNDERTKSEIRRKELKEKVIQEELRECSFRPVINKYAGGTEVYYEKAFAKVEGAL